MHLESWLEGRKPQSPVVPKVDRTNVSWKDIGGCTTPTQIIHLLGPSLIDLKALAAGHSLWLGSMRD